MKIRWMLVCLGLLGLLIVSPPAQAHHTTRGVAPGQTYWKCYHNGTKSKGTTRVHIHHTKPGKRHMKRHHCKKRTKPAAVAPAPATSVQTQVVEKIVYVPVPSAPCSSCKPDPCDKPKPPPPPPCEKGEDTHKHQRGEGHRKCHKGQGHHKDHDQEDDD